jgi:hypothetical protein
MHAAEILLNTAAPIQRSPSNARPPAIGDLNSYADGGLATAADNTEPGRRPRGVPVVTARK